MHKHSRRVIMTLILALFMTTPLLAQGPLQFDHEQFTLPNGLNVILYEDHTIPMASVNIWYHVGSKNEVKGRTGFAHLFEHMMFQGSPNFEGEYFGPLQKIGATINGSTNFDRTNYWENVPSNYLELALAMESDRMANLPDAMTEEALKNQIDVVQNERRQGVDNAPYGIAHETLLKMAFPAEHPYSWPTIGSLEDLENSTLQDVINFFRTYYTPNNASICVGGDIDLTEAKALVEKYFAPIPPGPPVTRQEFWIPKLEGVKRASATDDVPVPRVYMRWHTPPYYAPGDGEFDIFGNILTSGKNSRLYKALVYDQEIAQSVFAYQSSSEICSEFNLVATAKPGHTAEALEAAIDVELKKILAEGFTQAELEEAKNTLEAGFVRGLQDVGGFGGIVDRLNQYYTFVDRPDAFQWDMDRWTAPTVDDVMKYVRQYIDLNRRVILYINPQGTLAETETGLDRKVHPEPQPEPTFAPPTVQSATLDNGIKILLVEEDHLPLVDMELIIKRGMADDPTGKFGLASITSDLLNEGTKTRSSLEIAQTTKRLGLNLGTNCNKDYTSVSLNSLKKTLDEGLELMADIVLNPTFPQDELDRLKKQYAAYRQQMAKQVTSVGVATFNEKLYGANHPFSQPPNGIGTEDGLASITRDDIVNFYKQNYLPNVSGVVICGNLTMDEAKARLNKVFGSWKQGTVTEPTLPTPPKRDQTEIYFVDKPGAAQSYIIAGNLSMEYDNEDRFPFTLLNMALGGQFSSRINLNLREDKGYTYGAHSTLSLNRQISPFYAYSQVQGDVTAEALNEMVKELREIRTTRPLSDEEIDFSRGSMIKKYPQGFEGMSSITNQLAGLYEFDRPLDSWAKTVSRIQGVTKQQLNDAAKNYIDGDNLLIVVVGDRAQNEEKIKSFNLGTIMN